MPGLRINSIEDIQTYIKAIAKQATNSYNGLLCEVLSYDNFKVSVKIVNGNGILQMENIPIISNKYSRPFIQAGDKGILINIHNDIYNTLIGLENSFADVNSFVFLPITYQADANAENANGNVKIDVSPDGSNIIKFSNSGIDATLSQHTENISGDLTINDANTTIKSSGSVLINGANVTISSGAPIAMSASGESAQLGSLLAEILDCICQGLDDAGLPQIIEHTAYQNANLPTDISNLKTLIGRLKKVLS